ELRRLGPDLVGPGGRPAGPGRGRGSDRWPGAAGPGQAHAAGCGPGRAVRGPVSWCRAAPTRRSRLGGTNLFEFLPTLDLLVATRAAPGLAADLAAEAVLLRAYLRAQ